MTPFFRTCPFCKEANLSISRYGTGTVNCACGVVVPVKANDWEALHEAAVKWNNEVDEMQRTREEEDAE